MKIILFLLLLAGTPLAFAQSANQTSTAPDFTSNVEDQSQCEKFEFNEALHTAFRIGITHDPAVRQLIEENHDDPASTLSFDKTEGSFTIFSNSTDYWNIIVDLGFADKDPTKKHETHIDITGGDQPFMTYRKFITGESQCFIFNFFATPPPKQWTVEELFNEFSKFQESFFVKIVERFDVAIQKLDLSMDMVTLSSVTGAAIVFFILTKPYLDRKRKQKISDSYALAQRRFDIATSLFSLRTKSIPLEIRTAVNEEFKHIHGVMDIMQNQLNTTLLELKRAGQAAKLGANSSAKPNKETEPDITTGNDVTNLVKEEKTIIEQMKTEKAPDNPLNIPSDFINEMKSKISDIPGTIKDKLQKESEAKSIDEYVREYKKLLFADPHDHKKGLTKIEEEFAIWQERAVKDRTNIEALNRSHALLRVLEEASK